MPLIYFSAVNFSFTYSNATVLALAASLGPPTDYGIGLTVYPRVMDYAISAPRAFLQVSEPLAITQFPFTQQTAFLPVNTVPAVNAFFRAQPLPILSLLSIPTKDSKVNNMPRAVLAVGTSSGTLVKGNRQGQLTEFSAQVYTKASPTLSGTFVTATLQVCPSIEAATLSISDIRIKQQTLTGIGFTPQPLKMLVDTAIPATGDYKSYTSLNLKSIGIVPILPVQPQEFNTNAIPVLAVIGKVVRVADTSIDYQTLSLRTGYTFTGNVLPPDLYKNISSTFVGTTLAVSRNLFTLIPPQPEEINTAVTILNVKPTASELRASEPSYLTTF